MDQANLRAGTVEELVEQVRQEFLTVWRNSPKGDSLPILDHYLNRVPPAQRPGLKEALEELMKAGNSLSDSSATYSALSSSDSHLREDEGTKNELGDTLSEIPLPEVKPTEKAPAPEKTLPLGSHSHSDPELTITFEPTPMVSHGTYVDVPQIFSKKTSSKPMVSGYEILGELGRGGMGVVYKARHQKLHRVVALKMVLSGSHASQAQLDRFLVEAESVARLQHPNIVQIYEIGEHDNLPYFSLEYVDGGNLTQLINGKPLAVKKAAEMGELLAQAMASAHEHGIIHRDLKPANILLTKDGLPKITDFGLAKRLESDSSQTKSGTLMGTPSYMAPEQASGDTHEIGPLADVYALGVILYEMLVGRPPFVGTSIVDTLQQVQRLEPVSPRQLVPAIPIDLETICLKCLQKESTKRYPSARALADDLRRFLSGEPILARPVSQFERTYRWCRRNPGIATLAGAVALLLVVMTTGSIVAAIVINKEKQDAVEAKIDAQTKEKEAKAAQLLADEHALVAETQSGLALEAFGTLVDEVQRELGDAPGMQKLKESLLSHALEGLTKVASSNDSSSILNRKIELAYVRMGDLSRQLGKTEDALKHYQRGFDTSKSLVADYPESDLHKENLAVYHTKLGEIIFELKRDFPKMLEHYRAALALYTQIDETPQIDTKSEDKADPLRVKKGLAEAITRIGVCLLRQGEPAKALKDFEKALGIRETLAKTPDLPKEFKNDVLQDLARSYDAVALVSSRLNQIPRAIECLGLGLGIRETLVSGYPKNLRMKWEWANSHGNLIELAIQTKDQETALKYLEPYIKINQELTKLDEKNTVYQRSLGAAFTKAGIVEKRAKHPGKALEYFQECRKLREKLVQDDPKNDRKKVELMLAIARCGDVKTAIPMAEEIARKNPKDNDRELLLQLATCYAQCCEATSTTKEEKGLYTKKAVDYVKKAIAAGYKDFVQITTDADFESIHNNPDFLAIVKTIQPSSTK